MKRKTLALALALVLVFSLVIPVSAAAKVVVSPQTIVVNGKAVSAEVYNIDGSNYFKLRDMASLLTGTDSQFAVAYNADTRAVTATTGSAYAPVGGELATGSDKSSTCVVSTQTIAVDGLTLGVAVYNIGGNNYFKLRDLGTALGFDVAYNESTNTATVTSKKADSVIYSVTDAIALGAYKWTLSEDGTYYALKGVHYCTNVLCPEYQFMNIYVPAAYMTGGTCNGYTSATAPIVFQNNCSGWMSSTPGDADTSCLKAGYVFVSCGARSRGAGDNGQYGKAPCAVVDLKSGVRMLKLNGAVIPGNENEIVSVGTSGGGQMSSILGASGNMDEYYSYLYANGAPGITYTNGKYASTLDDSVYGCQCYCPITDINNADLAYAWWRYDAGDTEVTPMFANSPVTFSAFQLALQNDLAQKFCEYINSLGIKDAKGNVLSFDKNADGTYNPRSGSFYTQVLQNMSDALNAFIKGYTNSDGSIDITVKSGFGPNATSATTHYESVEKYISASFTNTANWLKKNSDGTYSITDMAGFINGTKLVRNKNIPGFDTLDLGAENNAFGLSTETAVHYSANVAAVLKANYYRYSQLAGFDKTTVDQYIEQGLRADIGTQTYLMNSTQIMLDVAKGTQTSDIAQYWRTRNGTADQHTCFSIAYDLCMSANMAGAKGVDYSLVWAMPHGSDEGTSTGTFVDWVASICAK